MIVTNMFRVTVYFKWSLRKLIHLILCKFLSNGLFLETGLFQVLMELGSGMMVSECIQGLFLDGGISGGFLVYILIHTFFFF